MPVKQEIEPAVEAWTLIWRLMQANKPRMMRLAQELDLAPMQLHALRLIEPGKEVPMGALAQSLFCDPSNVTGIVDRLEARGLIERRAADGDRRVKILALTAEGERVRAEASLQMEQPPPEIAALPARRAGGPARRASRGARVLLNDSGPDTRPGPEVIPEMRVLRALWVRRRAALMAEPARGDRPEAADQPGAECAERPAGAGEVEAERRVERDVARAHRRETERDRRVHERELEAAVLGPDALAAVRGEGSRDHRGDQNRRGERNEEAERQQQAAEELGGSGERRVHAAPGRSPSASKKPAGALDAVSPKDAEQLLGAVAHEKQARDRVQSQEVRYPTGQPPL